MGCFQFTFELMKQCGMAGESITIDQAKHLWNLPQCQTDGLNSFSTSAKQTVLLHINQQIILTPDKIANSTYIYTACRTRAWSATIASSHT
jgi:hypothetical protein